MTMSWLEVAGVIGLGGGLVLGGTCVYAFWAARWLVEELFHDYPAYLEHDYRTNTRAK